MIILLKQIPSTIFTVIQRQTAEELEKSAVGCHLSTEL